MTNYEYYKKDIERFARLGVPFKLTKSTGKVTNCNKLSDCEDCIFSTLINCTQAKIAWADEIYEEPAVDWAKVPIDTKVFVRLDGEWVPRHFAGMENGRLYVFSEGKTSFTTDHAVVWDKMKLANEEEIM